MNPVTRESCVCGIIYYVSKVKSIKSPEPCIGRAVTVAMLSSQVPLGLRPTQHRCPPAQMPDPCLPCPCPSQPCPVGPTALCPSARGGTAAPALSLALSDLPARSSP
jgi:hypothetical protein